MRDADVLTASGRYGVSGPFGVPASSRNVFSRGGAERRATARHQHPDPRRRGAWWQDLSAGPWKTFGSWMERKAALAPEDRPGEPFSAWLRGLRVLRVRSPAPRTWPTPLS